MSDLLKRESESSPVLRSLYSKSAISTQKCSYCGHLLKGVSEARSVLQLVQATRYKLIYSHRKHLLRHEKSHKCDLPNCPRGKLGFGTINDLERHKKSKHGIRPRHGATKSYRCASRRCKMSSKLWPRLDNFKQHVKRVHKSENMQELIIMSATSKVHCNSIR